ncbi:hypothetical protein J6590_061798 [Homalodisca vitripennis]|nr:hypothetical protein J6590_061798 [Homalodisca vitripennis]
MVEIDITERFKPRVFEAGTMGFVRTNVAWCPSITTLRAVPNLREVDRYTRPRWSERLSYRGKEHPQDSTQKVLYSLLKQGPKQEEKQFPEDR